MVFLEILKERWAISACIEDTYEILNDDSGRRKVPRAAIVLSQSDSYAATIASVGGPLALLDCHLPHLSNRYGWLDVFAASAVDRTELDDDGNEIPAKDFKPSGLQAIMDWVINRECADKCRTVECVRPQEVGTCSAEPRGQKRLKPGEEFALGLKYEMGHGVKVNYQSAAEHYRIAAEHGHAEAQNNLGFLYEHGKGVVKDLAEALKWYRLSAENNNGDAILALQRLEDASVQSSGGQRSRDLSDLKDVNNDNAYVRTEYCRVKGVMSLCIVAVASCRVIKVKKDWMHDYVMLNKNERFMRLDFSGVKIDVLAPQKGRYQIDVIHDAHVESGTVVASLLEQT